MPIASCVPAFLPGFALRDIRVPLAKRGFPASPLWGVPDLNAGTRRGKREFIVTYIT
jgi:hypothetical protein